MLEKFKNLKVKSKLNIGFFAMFFFMIIISIISFIFMYNLYNKSNDASTEVIEPTHDLFVINDSIDRQRVSLYKVVMYSDTDKNIADSEIDKISEQEKRLDEAYDSYIKNTTGDNANRIESLLEEKYYLEFNQAKTNLLSEYEKQDEEAILKSLDSINTIGDELVTELSTTVDIIIKNLENTMSKGQLSFTFMVLGIVGVLVFAMFAIINIVNRITRSVKGPVTRMSKIAGQVADTGNLTFSDETMEEVRIDSSYNDEVGQTTRSFSKMMDDLVEKKDVLEHVASGDLTVRVNVVSPEDTLGNSINTMIDSLREMVIQIDKASTQINKGAEQLSNGAQLLAQGSSQQSSSVEHLQSSMADVSEKAEASMEVSNSAASVSLGIKKNAADGRVKMNELREASDEVHDSSQAIGQVTKAIEDIAFQTNILSLNAAIEAARAGVNGKGFSVVAEEVRNLAGKSGEAANETSKYVAESINKTEISSTLAKNASESFDLIAGGIDQAYDLATQLSEHVEAQRKSAKKIEETISQLSNVIHQNSSAAEETAASTEEMTSQTETLRSLISGFKIE